LGYHHEWAPGVHTLVFGARLADNISFTNQTQSSLIFSHHPSSTGTVWTAAGFVHMNEIYTGRLEIYSGEIQQIFDQEQHSTILGFRTQYGHIQTKSEQGYPDTDVAFFPTPPDPAADQNSTVAFKRLSAYGYHNWEITDWLELIGGASYDWVSFPKNFRNAPISSREETIDQVSPKAGLILQPFRDTVVRLAYTRSLSGASIDQSFQLEPSQVAGFVQSFRSIIPEALAGANAGARFETYGLSLEQKLPTRTYLGLSGQILNSVLDRADGAFTLSPPADFAVPVTLREHMNYSEQSVSLTGNQLIGNDWALGAVYRLSRAVLHDDFPEVPSGALPFPGDFPLTARQRVEGVLNNLNLFVIYNSPCGFFAEGQALWYAQNSLKGMPGDDFWQFNAFAGYRFPRRRAEITLGLLNISGQNYKLNPLNVYSDLPRERTIAVRFSVHF